MTARNPKFDITETDSFSIGQIFSFQFLISSLKLSTFNTYFSSKGRASQILRPK